MKALKVFEVANFERGGNPMDSLDIGIKSWVQNFDTNYFKLNREEREEATERFNLIMSKINFEEIPFDTKYLPLEAIFGFKYDQEENDWRTFKLDYDLYLSIKDNGYYSSPESWRAYITDEKGRIISANSSSSAGKKAVDTISLRTGSTKRKFRKKSFKHR
jgi:hypothetical protein